MWKFLRGNKANSESFYFAAVVKMYSVIGHNTSAGGYMKFLVWVMLF